MPCDVCGGTIYPGDGCCDDCYFAKVMDLRTDYDRGLDDGRGLERAANERKMRATIDQLKLELAQEKKVSAQLQRNIDYWVNQYNELYRQYMIKDLSQYLGGSND